MSSTELEKLAEYLPENASYEWEGEGLDSFGLITQATIALFKISEGDKRAENDLDKLIGLEEKLTDKLSLSRPTILAEIRGLLENNRIEVKIKDSKFFISSENEITQELREIKLAEAEQFKKARIQKEKAKNKKKKKKK